MLAKESGKIGKTELVTIIIPAYNAEKYVLRCVKSVLVQLYYNFELIVIDDGSIDGTGKMLDQYAELDERVTVIHIRNNGVSAARNVGLTRANGLYISFIDADDYVSPHYLYNMMERAGKTLVAGGMITEDERGAHLSTSRFDAGTLYVDNASKRELLINGVLNSVWAKLFDVEIIKMNNLCFDEEIDYAEDTDFVVAYLRYVQTINIIENVDYHYIRYDTAESLSSIRGSGYEFITRAKAGNLAIMNSLGFEDKSEANSLLLERMSWVYPHAFQVLAPRERITLFTKLIRSDNLFRRYILFRVPYVMKKIIHGIIERFYTQ